MVEDDRDILTLLLKHLRSNGFVPTGFTSSHEALYAFKTEPDRFSLILTDYRMPDLNGVQLAQEILKIKPQTKVVITTATELQAEDVQVKLPIITHADVIHKPFKLVEICSRVRELTALRFQ